jgi:hypothetical protein
MSGHSTTASDSTSAETTTSEQMAGSTDTTTAFSTSADASSSEGETGAPLTSEYINWETTSDESDITFIIVGVVAGVLVVCGLIVIVMVIIVRRRRSNSYAAADNSIPMAPLESDTTHYTSISRIKKADSSRSFSTTASGKVASSADDIEKRVPSAPKSWEINYSELKILETVGEGAFGTVHRAIFRHHEVAVKQLKNQIDKREVHTQH